MLRCIEFKLISCSASTYHLNPSQTRPSRQGLLLQCLERSGIDMRLTWVHSYMMVYLSMSHLYPTYHADPSYHLTQTFQFLQEAAGRHPTCLNHLTIFATLYTISVANAPIQKRSMIRVDAARPCGDEFRRIDYGVNLLRVEPGLCICKTLPSRWREEEGEKATKC